MPVPFLQSQMVVFNAGASNMLSGNWVGSLGEFVSPVYACRDDELHSPRDVVFHAAIPYARCIRVYHYMRRIRMCNPTGYSEEKGR